MLRRNSNRNDSMSPLLIQQENRYWIAMPDPGARSMDRVEGIHRLPFEKLLRIAITIVEDLVSLHDVRILHRDIKPSNIILNREGMARLIDFNISVYLPEGIDGVEAPTPHQGTLPYLAPEQTGRINRLIDFRSDLYSVGATLFWIFSGQAPFQGKDELETLHRVIAYPPPALADLNPALPGDISLVVEKLLQKLPENRYRSARGLLFDLKLILQRFESEDSASPFLPGANDHLTDLQLTQGLFGRETEMEQLNRAFQSVVQGGVTFYTVAGYSGIGKSSLIFELERTVIERHGSFLAGKYDQYNRSTPYSAIIAAISSMIQQILGESEESILTRKGKIREAISSVGGAMIELIPDLELITGPMPQPPPLSASEAEHRFFTSFLRLIQSFQQNSSPLVLFLDDLQWIDASSLQFLRQFLQSPETSHIMVIGAFRNNEMDATHPLIQMIKDLDRNQVQVEQIVLESLDVEALNRWISESFLTDSQSVSEFSRLIHERTGGNPFFATQFIRNLHRKNLIRYEAGRPVFDMKEIRDLPCTDNVVELMIERILTLPEDSVELLRIASCLGNPFSSRILSPVTGLEPETINGKLFHAIDSGFIVAIESNLFDDNRNERSAQDRKNDRHFSFRFFHDRIQQAAYSLIPESDRQDIHLRIARFYMKGIHEGHEEDLIPAAGHIQASSFLINDPEERDQACNVLLKAAIKSRDSAAFSESLHFLEVARNLLQEDAWTTDFSRMHRIHVELLEMYFQNVKYEEADAIGRIILQHSQRIHDRAPVYRIELQKLTSTNRMEEAVNRSIEILRENGIRIPREPGTFRIIKGLLQSKIRLSTFSRDRLIHLPPMKDPDALALMHIMNMTLAAAYMAAPNVMPIIVFEMLRFSLKYGLADTTPNTLIMYGIIHCGPPGDYRSGFRYGQLARTMADRIPSNPQMGQVLFTLHFFLAHWGQPLAKSIPELGRGIQEAYEYGNLMTASFALHAQFLYRILCGEKISILKKDHGDYFNRIESLRQEQSLEVMKVLDLFIAKLSEDAPLNLEGKLFEDGETLSFARKAGNVTVIIYIYYTRLYLYYLNDEPYRALESAKVLMDNLASAPGMAFFAWGLFYEGLARTSIEFRKGKGKINDPRLKKILSQLRYWAKLSPDNFENKVALIEAEIMAIRGDRMGSLSLYNTSIVLAKKNGFIAEAALAAQRTGTFLHLVGQERAALGYLLEARETWSQWEFTPAVKSLDQKYPFLKIRFESYLVSDGVESTEETSSSRRFISLDLFTVMKASQAISEKLDRSDLTETMLKIMTESAGATRCIFFQNDIRGPMLRMEGPYEGSFISHAKIPLEECTDVPASIIRYVNRSGKNLILSDAQEDSTYLNDPYIRRTGARAVLCLPIRYGEEQKGILYLENNIHHSIFSASRVEILELLASQFGISMENASLYEELEQKVEERTRELKLTQEKLIQLEKDNTEKQMAGGFAHEMRNALSGSRILLEQSVGFHSPEGRSLPVSNNYLMKDIYSEMEPVVSRELAEKSLSVMKKIFENNNRLDELLRIVERSVRRGLNITHQVLEYSRIGRESGGREILSPAVILRRILDEKEQKLQTDSIALQIDLDDEIWFAGLENHIYSIFNNLIQNAIDAMEEQPDSINKENKLTVIMEKDDGSFKVIIRDTGSGIRPEHREKVYETFFSTKPETGTGLGLKVVKKLIEVYQGNIQFRSKENAGTEFVIRLPRMEKVNEKTNYP